jgi:SNF2 family DNA or RNA helicase
MSGHADDEDRGKIIINDAAAEGQGFIYVHPHIARCIKKHQIEGVRFMWNQIVTSLGDMQGCLLAHTMGLGKTLQSITLLVAIAEAARSIDPTISCQIPECLQVSRTLVLCPPGLLDNWMDELLLWTPDDLLGELRKVDSSVKLSERLQIVTDWANDGGVLLLGYEMFRILINNPKGKLSQEQHEKVRTELLDMPNIIIADEAHKMKNAKAEITTAAMQFKSASRIALTGSPLANNIEEYHTMIDWVCPNYLGTSSQTPLFRKLWNIVHIVGRTTMLTSCTGPIAEFREKYVEPIQDGLYRDSTHWQRRKGLKMLGVLKDGEFNLPQALRTVLIICQTLLLKSIGRICLFSRMCSPVKRSS